MPFRSFASTRTFGRLKGLLSDGGVFSLAFDECYPFSQSPPLGEASVSLLPSFASPRTRMSFPGEAPAPPLLSLGFFSAYPHSQRAFNLFLDASSNRLCLASFFLTQ